MVQCMVGLPIKEEGFTVLRGKSVDGGIGVEGVIEGVGGRDFLKDAAIRGGEGVAHTAFDGNDLAREDGLEDPVEGEREGAGEDLEGFFFDIVEMFGMGLTREDNDDFFTVFAVDDIDDGSAVVAEVLDTIVMAEFEFELGADDDFSLVEHTFDIVDKGAGILGDGGEALFKDGLIQGIITGGDDTREEVTAGQLVREARHGEEDVIGSDRRAGGDGASGKAAACKLIHRTGK